MVNLFEYSSRQRKRKLEMPFHDPAEEQLS